MERSGSELPVVYESPWRALGRDLRAVAASGVLALRRLWRRQWQGDLPTPAFWPRRQATLFWPVLVLVLVLLCLAGERAVRQLPGELTPQSNAPVPEAKFEPPAQGRPESPEGETDLSSPTESVLLNPVVPAMDPLLVELTGTDSPLLLIAALPHPAESLLEIELSENFRRLSTTERQEQAEAWLQRASSLGYERIRLIDRFGNTLARTAVVGEGMIMLD